MPGSKQHVHEDAMAVDVEPALDCAHALDSRLHEAVVPARPHADVLDVLEELVDGRVVPVGHAPRERGDRLAPPRRPNGEPGERRRRNVAVALRAHAPLADRLRALAPRRRGIGAVAEDDDLLRREPAVAQRRVRAEPRQASADDCTRRVHGYLTEPASSPWTK